MRLSPKEISAIQNAFRRNLHVAYGLYLFGSRVDDSKKGGDIDLLVAVSLQDKLSVVELKVKILISIFETLPEQRIDITVATPEELQTDAFLKSISRSMIKI